MEDFKKNNANDEKDKEIIFSKSIKAGKRIYYLDVKNSRRNEKFLTITESKKIITGEGENAQISFEKHKIWIYKEDLRKFLAELEQTIEYIENDGNIQHPADDYSNRPETIVQPNDELKIDIDFD